MAINLLELQPNKVSRDLSGYITYVYGAPKNGKTTLAQVFTDVRYKKADNEFMSNNLKNTLKKQGFDK